VSSNLQLNFSFDHLKNYLHSLDFSLIIKKMISYDGWRELDTLKTCEYYKNYLYLLIKYGDHFKLPPSEDIDDFWHNHILDTKAYLDFCHVLF